MKALMVLITFFVTVCYGDDTSIISKSSLIYVQGKSIYRVSLDGKKKIALIKDAGYNLGGISANPRSGLFFWADLTNSVIRKSDINKMDKGTKVLSKRTTYGLAIDWMYNHVYLTNSYQGSNSIEVTEHVSTRYEGDDGSVILYQDFKNIPNALTLNPNDGWLFWLENGTHHRIMRGAMDGSTRAEPVVENIIGISLGIALDLVHHRLYWSDNTLLSISRCDYNGANRHDIISLKDPPLLISMFEDWVYWTTGKGIYKANKFDGKQREELEHRKKDSDIYSGIMVYLPEFDYVRNLCQDGHDCMCLPSPRTNETYQFINCKCIRGQGIGDNGCQNPRNIDDVTTPLSPTTKKAAVITTTTEKVTTTETPNTFLDGLSPEEIANDRRKRMVFCFSRK